MTIALHVCRGNFRSTWFAAGGYEPVAEELFSNTKVDAFFLEYDNERAGDFEPLRFIKDQFVVLGLVTTKHGGLESKEQLKARIEEAAQYVDIEKLCLSPQCGFASTEEGNMLTEEEQWDKIRLVIETAQEIWV
ncbi:5-methyltetrahydropteroyltriglutamate--homocysteine methyltransferase [compost metagenome]